MTSERVRVGAVADLHYTRDAKGSLQPLFEYASRATDVLVLAGDLTDFGLPEEAQVLARDLTAFVRVPVVAVLGNHDYETGNEAEVTAILRGAGVHLLDGGACEVKGLGFAGAKGFAGGFGRATLEPWGEATVKQFVREAVDEALKLERALARLRTSTRIALLHYAPVQGTVEGEPPEIFAFLGCSRLEEPINRLPVTVVIHGHAHRGSVEGRTAAGIPVHNVSLPLLRRLHPDAAPLRVLEFPLPEASNGEVAGSHRLAQAAG